MLNGIGGTTIAEAKERLTHDEFLYWIAYIDKYGTLDRNQRLERGIALMCVQLNRLGGGKAINNDFMIYSGSVTGSVAGGISIEAAMLQWE